jgi:hypothetical protein
MHQVKLFFLILFVNFAYPSLSNLVLQSTTYKQTINQWLPAIMIAGILAISIIAIVFAIGEAFNIDRLKIYASSEIPQVIATLLFSLLIVSILEFGSSILLSFEDSILPQAALQEVCNTISSANQNLNLLSPSDTAAYGLDALYGIAYKSTIPSICEVIQNRQGNEPYYFLASSEILLLNNTAKLINFSNSLYVLHTILSFYKEFTIELEITPIVDIKSSPYLGFTTLGDAVKSTERDVITYISFNFISIMLLLFVYNYWVGLLMAGIFLRAFSFTRRLGGFLIAFVISAIFITPLTYILIYQVLTNQHLFPSISMNPDPSIQPVCPSGSQASSTTSGGQSSQCGICLTGTTPKSDCSNIPKPLCPSSYPTPQCVLARVGRYEERYCWKCVSAPSTTPPTAPTPQGSLAYQGFCGCFYAPSTWAGGVIGWEVTRFFTGLTQVIVSPEAAAGVFGYACNLDTATAYVAFLGSADFIGRIAVETYLFPLIGFFVTLANILGLSWLFGGTTRIFGLERLVG